MIRVYMTACDPETDKKREHRIGRELLCRGLAELYGITETAGKALPACIEELLCEGEFGKPFLRDMPEIHFNISNCRGLVVCGFAEQPIGIDAEEVRPIRDPLIRRVLHEEELRELGRFGVIEEKKMALKKEMPERSPAFLRLFFRYWTLKESYLKQSGIGLTREPREICFFVDPDDWDSPVHASVPGVVCLQKMFVREETDTEYIASVCVPDPTGTETGWSDLEVTWIPV